MSSRDVAPQSPFSTSSWEPRFVVEHYDDQSLHHAVELWRSCSSPEFRFPADALIRSIKCEPTWLRLGHPRDSSSAWDALPAPVVAASVPSLVRDWLETATYPATPSFDGAAAKGYSVFGTYFGSPRGSFGGSLVVLPKWFEIHK